MNCQLAIKSKNHGQKPSPLRKLLSDSKDTWYRSLLLDVLQFIDLIVFSGFRWFLFYCIELISYRTLYPRLTCLKPPVEKCKSKSTSNVISFYILSYHSLKFFVCGLLLSVEGVVSFGFDFIQFDLNSHGQNFNQIRKFKISIRNNWILPQKHVDLAFRKF